MVNSLNILSMLLFLILISIVSPKKTYIPAKNYTIENNNVSEYLGIPFAKPPIGNLRFEAPEKIDETEGEFNASYPAATCPQIILPDIFPFNFSGFSIWNPPRNNVSEDCLQLNMWVPENKTGGVLVMIHGGAYYSLSASLDLFNGTVLAAISRAIVVTINYRVGALGFARLNGVENITGNMGLLDQQMALKWINESIESFGGNTSKITLIGEHAGSSSAVAHLFAEGSKDLFSRIILASGNLENIWATQNNSYIENATLALAKGLNCTDNEPEKILSYMKNNISDPMYFPNVTYKIRGTLPPSFGFPFAITLKDGKFFTKNISEMSIKENMKNVSFMLGDTGNEGSFFLYNYFKEIGCTINFTNVEDPLKQCNINETQFRNITKTVQYILGKNETWLKQLEDHYNATTDVERRNNASRMMSDLLFDCGLLRFVKQITNITNNDVYLYVYNYTSSSNPWPKWMGAVHASSMETVFGYPFRYPEKYNNSMLETDKNVSRNIMKMYGEFANNGVPGSEWKKYNSTGKNSAVLDATLNVSKIEKYIHLTYPGASNRCDLFKPYIIKSRLSPDTIEEEM